MAGFVIDAVVADDVVGPATLLLALVAAVFVTAAALTANMVADEELAAAAAADADVVVAAAATVPPAVPTTADATVVKLCESSLCHLALLWRAAFICVHNSFLQDFDLNTVRNKYKKIKFVSLVSLNF